MDNVQNKCRDDEKKFKESADLHLIDDSCGRMYSNEVSIISRLQNNCNREHNSSNVDSIR